MRALLLSAGLGTRLRPLTESIPKCLVPIHEKPLLEYWLELLFGDGQIDRALVNMHYLPDAVHRFIANSRYASQIELVYEPELLGTGGTVLKNKNFFSDQAFMVIHADNLSQFNLHEFILRHQSRPNGCSITMMTFETDQPRHCGIVELDSRDVVIGFHEKSDNPPGNLANGAVYIFEPEVLAFLSRLKKPVIDLSTEILPCYIGKIYTYFNYGYHRDIGTPESLRMAEAEFPGARLDESDFR